MDQAPWLVTLSCLRPWIHCNWCIIDKVAAGSLILGRMQLPRLASIVLAEVTNQ
jgi:hypothetical protein